MEVVLAKSAGFCWGVNRAVEKARTLAARHGTVYTDGPLIHNEQMMAQLRQAGVAETDHPESVGNHPILIRAHGIPPHRRRRLAGLPGGVIDATCPDVARIQGLIRRYARRGYEVIIFGDSGHAEVIGLLGFAEGHGHVVSRPADVDTIPDFSALCVVSQSTQFPHDYDAIATAVRARFPKAEIVVLDTICESTRNRQNELLAIAETVDAIVIVGGSHSANTLRLVELAKTVRPTFHIQTADQIDPAAWRGFRRVGLTAGASTPSFVIEQVRAALEKLS